MEDLITAKEAADILGVTVRQIHSLARGGIITPRYPQGVKFNSQQLFRPEEISAYAELREKKLGIAEMAIIARQAHVSCRALERTVERLMYVLSANIPVPDLREDSILATYEHVRAALINDAAPLPNEIVEWARLFYSIGEEYFEAVERFTKDAEPWTSYVALASKLCREAPPQTYDKELDEAYAYLAMSRRFLRQAAYFYIRNTHGKPVADRAFPETSNDLVSNVIALAFPS